MIEINSKKRRKRDDEEYIIQKFDLEESNVEEETMPEELPTEVEDYDHWTRETEWCKIVETQNASIYFLALRFDIREQRR